MTNLDSSTSLALIATWSVLAAALYVWGAAGLSAVFRKSGEEGWTGWVPVLNLFVLLRLGGLSGWLVALLLIPFVGPLAVWVLVVVACHRVGASFGYGGGLTVLAALLLPAWASVVGFGSARWIGRDVPAAGPRRAPMPDVPPPPPLPQSPSAVPPPYSPSTSAPSSYQPSFSPAPGPLRSGAGSPPPVPPVPPAAPPITPAVTPPGPLRRSGGPSAPDWASTPSPGWDDSASVPGPRRGGASAPTSDADWPETPETPEAPAGPRRTPALDDGDEWASEVTGAFSGAPAPISAVPATPVPSLEDTDPSAGAPLVSRVPAAPPAPASAVREPWAPASSPMPVEGEAFAETSAAVSAIAGAPVAGTPFSALSSVSAQHPRTHIPDEDEIDDTLITRRGRTAWVLVPPSGAAVPLRSGVAILGRRPSADPAFPDAQLVRIEDDTRTISKTHARLELVGDRWYITDLDSTNGVLFATLLGSDVAATPGTPIEAGDRFFLGDAELGLTRGDG